MTNNMKVLSIKQPWAWLIVNGIKDIENRTWATSFRGKFLVHSSKKFDLDGYQFLIDNRKKLNIPPEFWNEFEWETGAFTRGFIIGETTITDVVEQSESPWFFGPKGFVLTDSRPFKNPTPLKGKLGFFYVMVDNSMLL